MWTELILLFPFLLFSLFCLLSSCFFVCLVLLLFGVVFRLGFWFRLLFLLLFVFRSLVWVREHLVCF